MSSKCNHICLYKKEIWPLKGRWYDWPWKRRLGCYVGRSWGKPRAPRSRRGEKQNPPLKLPEGASPTHTLLLCETHLETLTSRETQNTLALFQPFSLWWCVIAAIEINAEMSQNSTQVCSNLKPAFFFPTSHGLQFYWSLEISSQRLMSCPNLNTPQIWNWVLNHMTKCSSN